MKKKIRNLLFPQRLYLIMKKLRKNMEKGLRRKRFTRLFGIKLKK